MIVHLDKEQTRLERRRLLADNSDIVFVLFHDILKEFTRRARRSCRLWRFFFLQGSLPEFWCR